MRPRVCTHAYIEYIEFLVTTCHSSQRRTKKVKESDIERWLVTQIGALGGIADKFVSPGNPGVPDRLIVLPNGRVIFAELKTEMGRLSGIQKWQRQRYQKMGVDYRVIKGMKAARELVKELKAELQKEVVPDEVHPT